MKLALDIDMTLSATTLPWMKQGLELFGNPENLSAKKMVKKYKWVQDVPYWKTKEARQWMEDTLNSEEFFENLPLIKGAIKYIRKISRIVLFEYYITARPDFLRKSTFTWLNKNSFPELELITRPEAVPFTGSNKWKASQLEKLYPEIDGIVDDDLGLATALSSDYKGRIFLFGYDSYEENDSRIVPCVNWKTTYKKIKNIYQ